VSLRLVEGRRSNESNMAVMKIKTAQLSAAPLQPRRALTREPAFRHPAVEKYLAGGVVA